MNVCVDRRATGTRAACKPAGLRKPAAWKRNRGTSVRLVAERRATGTVTLSGFGGTVGGASIATEGAASHAPSSGTGGESSYPHRLPAYQPPLQNLEPSFSVAKQSTSLVHTYPTPLVPMQIPPSSHSSSPSTIPLPHPTIPRLASGQAASSRSSALSAASKSVTSMRSSPFVSPAGHPLGTASQPEGLPPQRRATATIRLTSATLRSWSPSQTHGACARGNGELQNEPASSECVPARDWIARLCASFAA